MKNIFLLKTSFLKVRIIRDEIVTGGIKHLWYHNIKIQRPRKFITCKKGTFPLLKEKAYKIAEIWFKSTVIVHNFKIE